ncbi:MAG: hypothetical protein J6K81_02275 [Rikenellaceae bacterium]|nr:hypothetical protein [Rikenellaceae bacterium]
MIIRMKYKWIILSCMILLSMGVMAQTPEVTARVKGLESNEEYMSLLRQEQELTRQSDSIQRQMAVFRQEFRTDTLNRAARAVQILEIEEVLFELRDRLGELTGKINIIEQDWILQHLNESVAEAETEVADSTATVVAEMVVAADSLVAAEVADSSSRNLLYNEKLAAELTDEDLATIRAGQQLEVQLARDAQEYVRGHHMLLDLKNRHSMADSAALATRLFEEFTSVSENNLEIENRISDGWNEVFDNKSFTYNYLLDKLGNTTLRDSFNLKLNDIAARVAESSVPSAVVLNYALQRRALTEYELAIARTMGLNNAADSLISCLDNDDYQALCELSPVGRIAERVFLNYEDITVHKPSLYNSRNPIPECVIYPKGTIYRILVGTFSSEQSPTIFRGAAPLYVQKIMNKYRYFVGGFASDSTAFAAQEECLKIGFRKPEVVVWVDGQYFNLSEEDDNEEESRRFRVIIDSAEPLSEELVRQIKIDTNNADIVKIGDTYSIDNIEGYINALRLKESIEAVGKIPARIEEIGK